ncbi:MULTISPECIES: hypothetical protein [unclassified Streptomyces]|uniref:hypothetical protein n=1 Tax=unclassified Streptomyces TaxID=2593676 RepID=UPI0037B95604
MPDQCRGGWLARLIEFAASGEGGWLPVVIKVTPTDIQDRDAARRVLAVSST